MKEKVVFILGATATGKSDFAIKLAKKFDGEIISADSVQVYKKLDIGSAKQTDFCGIKHHLIDILEPEEDFSAFEFVEMTKQKIKEISKRKKLPIVVGGTALYVKALTEGFNFGGAEKDEKLRSELEGKSAQELFDLLSALDPKTAEKIDRFNKVRLVRAIEILKSSGKKTKSEPEFDFLIFALKKDRQKLYQDIDRRVDKMIEAGLVEEVKALIDSGIKKTAKSMQSIGYKEVISFLDGQISKQQMIELVKQHTRNYAKRQETFLKKVDCVYIDVENREFAFNQMCEKVEEFLK